MTDTTWWAVWEPESTWCGGITPIVEVVKSIDQIPDWWEKSGPHATEAEASQVADEVDKDWMNQAGII